MSNAFVTDADGEKVFRGASFTSADTDELARSASRRWIYQSVYRRKTPLVTSFRVCCVKLLNNQNEQHQ